MSQNEVVARWVESAESDIETAGVLLNTKKYAHCLFFCHLYLEKLFKAVLVQQTNAAPLATHDIEFLARKIGYPIDEKIKDYLSEISTFNVEARHDIDKQRLYKKATEEYTKLYKQRIEEMAIWLKKALEISK